MHLHIKTWEDTAKLSCLVNVQLNTIRHRYQHQAGYPTSGSIELSHWFYRFVPPVINTCSNQSSYVMLSLAKTKLSYAFAYKTHKHTKILVIIKEGTCSQLRVELPGWHRVHNKMPIPASSWVSNKWLSWFINSALRIKMHNKKRVREHKEIMEVEVEDGLILIDWLDGSLEAWWLKQPRARSTLLLYPHLFRSLLVVTRIGSGPMERISLKLCAVLCTELDVRTQPSSTLISMVALCSFWRWYVHCTLLCCY